MHVVLNQRRVIYVVGSADEVRRFAPLPRTVYLVALADVFFSFSNVVYNFLCL